MWEQITDFFREQIANNQFFSGAALAGIMGSIVYKLQPILGSIYSRIKRNITYTYEIDYTENSRLYRYVNLFLEKNYIHKFRNSQIMSDSHKDRNIRQEFINDTIYIIYKSNFLKITTKKKRMESAGNNISGMFDKTIVLSCLFSPKSADQFIKDAISKGKILEIEGNKKEDTWLFYSSKGDWWAKILDEAKTFEELFFPNKKDFVDKINKFKDLKLLYKKHKIPYKYGITLYGPPGTSKSSIIRALATYLKVDLYTLSLFNITTEQVKSLLSEIANGGILVMEDFDSVYNLREPVSDAVKLPYTELLNILSGVSSLENVIIIFTTNKLETFDEALLRPGRTDLLFEVKPLDYNSTKEFIEYFYSTKINLEPNIKLLAGAELQQIMLNSTLEETLSKLE